MKGVTGFQPRLIVLAVATALLTACGGGGGGSSNVKPTPADPGIPTGTQENLTQINAPAAWEAGYTGAGVTVAVIDSGVRATHETFGARVLTGYNTLEDTTDTTDDANHGTAVAGVIGGETSDIAADGIGVAPGVTLLPVKVTNGVAGEDDVRNVAEGIDYAASQGAKLANLSMVAPVEDTMRSALDAYTAAGGLLVVGAGNGGYDDPETVGYFAADWSGSVMVVGAVDGNNEMVSYSSRAGRSADYYLVAPTGVNTARASGDTDYGLFAGTSLSTPHVTGAAALLWEKWPALTAPEVSGILFDTATDLGDPGVDAIYGHGLLNIGAAMQPVGLTAIPMGDQVEGERVALTDTRAALGPAFGDSLARTGRLASVAVLDDYRRDFYVDLRDRFSAPESIDVTERLGALGAEFDERSAAYGGVRLNARYTSGPSASWALSEAPLEHLSLTGELAGGVSYQLGLTGDPAAVFGLTESLALPPMLAGESLGNPYLGFAGQARYAAFGFAAGEGFQVRALHLKGSEASAWADRAGETRPVRVTAVEAGYRVTPQLRLGLQVAQTVEQEDGLLGGEARGALAVGGDAATTSVGLNASWRHDSGLQLFGHYSLGLTSVDGTAQGLLRDFSGVRSNAWGLGLSFAGVWSPADQLGFAWSQPLRVTGGSVTLDVPVARTVAGDVVRVDERVSLVPSGLEQDLELFYSRLLSGDAALRAGLLYQVQPGHAADADDDVTLLVAYRRPF